jgi:hypothetical protein
MTFNDLEFCFNRSLSYSFTQKKLLTVFSVLILCGILVGFCRTLAYGSSNWISMSLIFLPIFLSAGILLALGIFIIRLYYHEIKSLKLSYRKILFNSWELIIGTTYLSIPPILIYLLLWVVLGVFILLKELPVIGEFVGVVLAFAPFLIILSSIILVFISLVILFFIAPAIALGEKEKFYLAKTVILRLRENIFRNLLFFFISICPLVFLIGFLSYASHLTGISYIASEHLVSISVRWFFLMIPFCLFLTPFVIFFFNFAAEAYNFSIKKGTTK